MKTLLTFAVMALLLQPLSAFAAHEDEEHSHENLPVADKPLTDVQVQPNEAVLEIHGIVCSFCSVGVQKKLSKLPFIDTSKYTKGVHVEIENQKVTVAIQPGEKADVKAMYDSITSGGYSPVQAWVADAEGKVVHYNADGK